MGDHMAGEKKSDLTPQEKKARRAQARAQETRARRAEREAMAMERWAVMRQKGMRHYVIKQGLITWTLMTSLIYILLLGVSLKFQFTSEILLQVGMAVFFFAIGGVLFGTATWYLSESRYKRHLAEKERLRTLKRGKK
jgi:uncharacterized integral membrane protein